MPPFMAAFFVSPQHPSPVVGLILRELTLEARMSETGPSIFDLSPSEKLQLVEDLWDDLAGTPEAVPVHDWQKQELARRKANLVHNPASGLSWDEVKHRVRARYAR
jgi:putative addiction module component (TIGR02574 family)